MIKKFITLSLVFALLYPLTALADPVPSFQEGTIVQVKGSFLRYVISEGKKMRLKGSYTFSQFGKYKEIIKADRRELAKIAEGEVIEMSRPKINGIYDAHEHFRLNGDMELYLRTVKKMGIKKAVFVGTGLGPDNKGYKEHTAALLDEQKKYPDEIIAFCTVDEADANAADYLEDCIDAGGKGVKILGGHPEFYEVALDNDVMKSVFKVANERDIPVIVHVSIVNLPKAKAEFMNLMNLYPDTRVNFAHYCSTVFGNGHLEQCGEFLDKFPNMYTDLAMGGGITRYFKFLSDPVRRENLRNFILKYQDRVLFGSDMIVAPKPSPTQSSEWMEQRVMCDLSLHQEKYYKCPVVNKAAKDKPAYPILNGLELPEEVLQKLYVENPKKWLKE